MNMTPEKWDKYYKFCFIRNPYDKIISAWNHINRFNIPFKNYLKLINTCNDVEYIHMFLPQVRNIINEKGKIDINYIGKFENLENDLTEILKIIGIKNIIHDVNKKMNKRDHMEFYKYYDQESLNIVNTLLKEDFAYLDYDKISNIEIFFNKNSLLFFEINTDIITNIEIDEEDYIVNDNKYYIEKYSCDKNINSTVNYMEYNIYDNIGDNIDNFIEYNNIYNINNNIEYKIEQNIEHNIEDDIIYHLDYNIEETVINYIISYIDNYIEDTNINSNYIEDTNNYIEDTNNYIEDTNNYIEDTNINSNYIEDTNINYIEDTITNNITNNNIEDTTNNNIEDTANNNIEYTTNNNIEDTANNNIEDTTNNNYIQNNKKICCLYVYYEKDIKYKYNFIYFLNNAILDEIDYYIIINGNSSVTIPQKYNIKVFYRENNGYDFGAYSHALKHIDKIYDYYFFINTSVIGPCIFNNNKKWYNYFIELFNKDIKIVGTAINIYKKHNVANYNLINIYGKKNVFSHIQTMFFCIDDEYLNYLQNINFFYEEELINKDFNYIITHKEIGLSQIALNNNWNINCLLPNYKNLDYRRLNYDINITSRNGDPYYNKSYFSKNIKKEDVIFYKMNRI